MLCHQCLEFFRLERVKRHEQSEAVWVKYPGTPAVSWASDVGMIVHPDYSSLHHSSQIGCTICTLIWRSLYNHNNSLKLNGVFVYLRTFRGENPYDQAAHTHLAAFAMPESMREDVMRAQSYMPNKTIPRVLMGFLAPFQVANGAEFGPILTNGIQRSLNDHSTGSDAAIKLAKWWLERCRALHRTCRNFQDIPRLPDRVIDVGPPDGSQEPKLFETDGVERGDYLTLSHCWGKTRSFVTKTRTVNERIRGIPISTMPKTFSDAVLITRMFGVRFLWIDALCILQDSSWDWEVQAAEMAAIFRNSLFTISAANAADNDGGCFVTRDGFLLRPHKLDPPVFKPTEAYENLISAHVIPLRLSRNVSNRAWILQEQILSPRTLVLDENHIHWRCCTSVASERHPGMKVIQNYDFMSRFQQSILDGVSWIRDSLPSQASFRTVWHDVVENYTSRSLTKRTDKLAAIHGLATALGTAARFTYIAGLWKEHIQLDLVWRRRRSSIQRDDSVRSPTQEAGEHMLEIPAPSWSWASLDSPVVYVSDDGHIPVFEGALIDAHAQGTPSRQTGFLNIEGNARVSFITGEGTIEVEGPDGIRREEIRASWHPDRTVSPGTMLWFLAIVRSYPKFRHRDYTRGSLGEPSTQQIAPIVHTWSRVYCLALAPTAPCSREFRRVGLSIWPIELFAGNGKDKIHENYDVENAPEPTDEIVDDLERLTLRQQQREIRQRETSGLDYSALRDDSILWKPKRIKARIV